MERNDPPIVYHYLKEITARSAPKNTTKSSPSIVHVSGYTKSNGTQVKAHTRSPPTTSKLFKHKITTNISKFVNSRNVQRLQIFNSDDKRKVPFVTW